MLRPNPINWTTIPVTDMDRAVRFYNAVFDLKLEPQEMGGETMAFLPMDAEAHGSSGALWKGEGDLKPGEMGPETFFGCTGDLTKALDRIEAAGGAVLSGKTPIGPNGFIAHARDSEGNRIGLHSTE